MKYFILIAAFFLSACSILPAAAPQTFYQIELPAGGSQPDAAPELPGTLMIDAPVAVLGINSGHILVQAADGHIDRVAHAAWIVSPDKMLHPFLIRGLTEAGLFSHVVDDSGAVDAAYELQSTIERFTLAQQKNSEPAQVEVAIRFTLLRLSDDHLLMSELFNAMRPVDAAHMAAVIDGFNAAVNNCLHQATQRIASEAQSPNQQRRHR